MLDSLSKVYDTERQRVSPRRGIIANAQNPGILVMPTNLFHCSVSLLILHMFSLV
jgi:hypothetical protein